ncbi:hypothetical protein [uncultured Fluviicola sp.]|jgi:hypothetical protein|uniref:hypothetical protein n=1 Tax=uncultured Fluviicola sp. TaxID=463303 RepID=UPI0025DB5EE0|nr:hypothetical protein [uncultured Fluviicola sp.]
MAAIETITSTLTNSPLSSMIENMGLSVATAQAALDTNSINMLKQLASSTVEIGENQVSLLNLGFVPSFYAFTEASFEAKMDFAMSESTAFDVNGVVSVETKMVSTTVSAGYARKFDQSASASSSIAARMVSLPPPENLVTLLKNLSTEGNTTT